MASFVDGCRFKSSVSGTANFIVDTNAQGFQTPVNAGAVNGSTYRYRAESRDLLQWEIGTTVYTAATQTFTRTPIFSSNANQKVNFTRAPEVALVFLAEDIALLQSLDGTLSALAALDSTAGFVTETAADVFTKRTLTAPAAGLTITNPAGTAGDPIFALANDLAAIEGLSTTGLIARTATDTATTRTITGPAAGITVTNGDGIAGNPTLALANDLAALEGLSTNGLIARTATDTATTRTITGPAAGITVSNGDGVLGNPTLALANDLSAVEGLSSTGIARRTGVDTWSVGTAVANSELATMAAYTFKGNNTGTAATPTDVDIAAVTLKASPAGTDLILISDQAAAGAWKRATITSVAGAGSVASLNGQTGTIVTGLDLLQNASLAVSAAGSALTIALKDASGADPSAGSPVVINFRNATGTTGTNTTISVTAATSLVVSSGSTLGVTSSTAFRLWVVGFNDAGTFRLAVINCSPNGNAVFPLADYGLASSTAEGGAGAADSSGVFYTGTAVTSKAYRILGFLEWNTTGVTAGTWTTTNLNRVQSYGPGVQRPGEMIQYLRSASGAVVTGTTTLPADDTIPQNTEGDEYLNQQITPISAANIIRISFNGMFASSATGQFSVALFQDSTANALAANGIGYRTAGDYLTLAIFYAMKAGTASATTFKLRAGNGNAGTTTFNGSGGARQFGGVASSALIVEEIQG